MCTANASPSGRSFQLDGVRGLAATSVVLLHVSSLFVDTKFPAYVGFDRFIKAASHTPLAAIWAGSAVIAFFILSGYALHRMLGTDGMTYGRYAVRRVLRLWIPYAVALIAAAAGILLIGSRPIPGQSDWLNALLGVKVTWPMLANHLCMIGVFDTRPLDFVIWSLVIEMRISLLFPLIFWCVNRCPWFVVLIPGILVGAAATYFNRFAGTSVSTLASTLDYVPYFVIGALFSRHEATIARWYRSIPPVIRVAAGLAATALYCNCLRLSATYSVMLGSSWLIIVALGSHRARRVLMWPVFQWLGRLSYSLYIVHAVVLLTLVNLLYPTLPFAAIAFIAIALIPLVAFASFKLVEHPAMRLSRLAARRIEARAVAGNPQLE